MKKFLLFSLLLLLVVAQGYGQTAPPADLTADLNAFSHFTTVSLTWQDSVNTRVKYVVYKKTGAADDTTARFMSIWTTRDKRFVDYHVRPGVTYSYHVTAVINRRESAPSNIAEATIPPLTYGKISGMLFRDSTDAVMLRGVVKFIPVLNSTGEPNLVHTDSNGYFSANLRTGQYYMFTASEGYVPEYYDNAATIQAASVITVNENDSLVYIVGLAKIVPPTFYSISGWVKDNNGTPVRAEVSAFITNVRHPNHREKRKLTARTDSLGNYTLTLKANDTVVIYTHPRNNTLLPEYWDNESAFAEADRIAVSGDVTGINITLDAKPVYNNGMSGSVRDSAGVTPLKARVHAFKLVNTHNAFQRYVTETDSATGGYSFGNIEPGMYILLTVSRGYKSTYFRYDGTITLNWRNADTVVVTASDIVSALDFRLQRVNRRNSGAVMLGNVTSRGGTALDGALTYALNSNNEVEGCAVSDLDGSFEIEDLAAGKYSLVASFINYQDDQIGEITIEDESAVQQVDVILDPDVVNGISDGAGIETQYQLEQNYPNPFNPATTISYSLPERSIVSLRVYNILGNEVATLVNGETQAGDHTVQFDASSAAGGLPTGIYYVKLEVNNTLVSVKKMTLMK